MLQECYRLKKVLQECYRLKKVNFVGDFSLKYNRLRCVAHGNGLMQPAHFHDVGGDSSSV